MAFSAESKSLRAFMAFALAAFSASTAFSGKLYSVLRLDFILFFLFCFWLFLCWLIFWFCCSELAYLWKRKSRVLEAKIRELEKALMVSSEKCAAERQGRIRAQQVSDFLFDFFFNYYFLNIFNFWCAKKYRKERRFVKNLKLCWNQISCSSDLSWWFFGWITNAVFIFYYFIFWGGICKSLTVLAIYQQF